MRAYRAVFPATNQCKLEPFELPSEPAAGQILVRTEMTLISPGTELASFTSRHTNFSKHEADALYPIYPGYSAAGRVMRVGDGVHDLQVGDRVYVHQPHASHAILGAREAIRIPEGVPATHATFGQLGAIALNGVRMANIALGDSVVVVGLGLVGLLATRMARLSGAIPVIVADLCEPRRHIGQQFGADIAVDPSITDMLDVLKARTLDGLADVVIEATGSPRVVANCFAWARRGGRVALLGSPHGKVEMDFYTDIHARNLHVIGAHVLAAHRASIPAEPWSVERIREVFFELVRRREIDLNPLISRRILPEEMESTYQSLAEAPGATLGVIVDWSQMGEDKV